MTIIKIEPNDNGSHANQTISGATPETFRVPAGWAVVPEDMLPLENFPFGDFAVEWVGVRGLPTATSWTPLPMPDPGPGPAAEPSQLDRIEAQTVHTAMMTGTLLEEV